MPFELEAHLQNVREATNDYFATLSQINKFPEHAKIKSLLELIKKTLTFMSIRI